MKFSNKYFFILLWLCANTAALTMRCDEEGSEEEDVDVIMVDAKPLDENQTPEAPKDRKKQKRGKEKITRKKSRHYLRPIDNRPSREEEPRGRARNRQNLRNTL